MSERLEQIRALGIGVDAIALRRRLHQNPELSEREFGTMELICGELERLGIPYEKRIAGTGVVGLLRGAQDGPTVGLRADMDALPIQEENPELPYASRVPGVMHACGHDAHTAILLGTARMLSAMRERLHGSVKLLFQPAEETIGGAARMIAAGCLENPHVDCVLGLHVDSGLLTGQIGVKNGKMYAASDMLDLRVFGKSCHGAHPDEGVDAILIAAAILNNLQSVVSRNVAATDAAVCTFGTIHGGNVLNQVADRVELTGILRTLDQNTRLYVRDRVRTIAEQTAAMLGGRAELAMQESYGPLINTDAVVDVVRAACRSLLGEENVVELPAPSMGVEDFSYFAAARPACFFHLGCRPSLESPRLVAHSCQFDVDDGCIPIGIAIQVENVLRLLK
ncbi:MAG: M20 family metallopeptidase [Oscillospiraceae bacterium]|nr:M20 family metallopeptidase [Oscillospiraceae bacterium]